MEIICKGIPNTHKRYRFMCIYCNSILIAEMDELKCIGHQYNEFIYEFYCPVCECTRTTDDSMMENVE